MEEEGRVMRMGADSIPIGAHQNRSTDHTSGGSKILNETGQIIYHKM